MNQKTKRLLSVALTLIMLFSVMPMNAVLADNTPESFTITWKNANGDILSVDSVESGVIPTYHGPALAGPNGGLMPDPRYKFIGWTPEVIAAYEDAVYTAVYEDLYAPKTFTVTWKNYDGTILRTEQVVQGNNATPDGLYPTKPSTATHHYYFQSWDKSFFNIQEDTVITAVFSEQLRTYMVAWFNADGSFLAMSSLAYGETPVYNGNTPTKAPVSDNKHFEFVGWTPEVTEVTEDASYTAVFKECPNFCTVTWKNYDGTTIKSDSVSYKATPVYNGETPTKPSDETFAYIFTGWDKELSPVTEDVVYVAVFESVERNMEIVWKNDDGTVLSNDSSYDKIPSKAGTAQYTYVFTGWTKTIDDTSNTITFTATYKQVEKTFTVTWKDDDGSVIKTDFAVPYGASPSAVTYLYKESSDPAIEYTFSGWDKELAPVTADVTYTAVYTESVATYAVVWKNYDGSLLNMTPCKYGDIPSYSGEIPEREGYTFIGWTPDIVPVVGETTYVAAFKKNQDSVPSYTITFNVNGGTPLNAMTEVPSGTTVDLENISATKEGYSFAGWYSDEGLINKVTSVVVSGDITLHAKWDVKYYTITWKNYDGAILATTTVAHGATPVYSGETPAKSSDIQNSYTFVGWDKEIASASKDEVYTATFDAVVNTYTVTWKNYDGSVIKSDVVEYGKMPSFSGETPNKAGTTQYSYKFIGWDKDIVSVTADATYTAVFEEIVNKYTVTWQNYDGSTLKETILPYGTTPAYDGETPKKTATEQYSFNFIGWNKDIVPVDGDVTYIATFDSITNKYTITWKNFDGEVLKTEEVSYGTVPTYTGETPVKPDDVKFSYVFNGWDNELVSVSGPTTYTAVFEAVAKDYNVVWKNDDGSVLSEEHDYEAVPVKEATAQYAYEFTGWDKVIDEDSHTIIYTATYKQVERTFIVTWQNFDGSTLKTDVVHYGITPAYDGELPTKPSDVQYVYTFKGWDKTIVATVSDMTYIATFSEEIREYEIIWKNDDGSILKSEAVKYGELPEYKGETPVKTATAQYSYTFAGWDKDIAEVSGTETYTATFDATVNKYTITWKSYDDSVLKTELLEYGATPAYSNKLPEREGYSFVGWTPDIVAVVADATYVADFVEVEDVKDTFTVKFETNGGSKIATMDKVPNGYVLDLNKVSTFREHCVFAGWYSDKGLTNKVTSVEVTDDITLYAKWDLASYTLTFKTNGGTAIDSKVFEYGTTVDLSKYTSKKEGFNLVGWYTDSALKNKVKSVVMDGDKTVYASWLDDDVPPTGDNSNIMLWIVIALASALGVTAFVVYEKKRKEQELE